MQNIIMIMLLSLASSVFAAEKSSIPSAKSEKRFGWIDNPSPANWILTDREGSWLIHSQGDYQAQGVMPDFGKKWVKTNVNYGYGCARMSAVVDSEKRRVISYEKVKILPISKCKADKKLDQKDRNL